MVFLFSAFFLYVLIYQKKAIPIFLLIFIMMLSGVVRFLFYRVSTEKITSRLDQSTISCRAVILDFSADGKAPARITHEGKSYKVYLSNKDILNMKPGDVFDITAGLYSPQKDKNSFFDFSAFLKSNNMLFYAKAESIAKVNERPTGVMGAAFTVRKLIAKASEKHFKGYTHSLYNSIILGDKSLIDEKLSALLKSAGLSHITVVSGMHLSIMVTVFTFLATFFLGKRRTSYFLTALLVIFITLICGGGVSVVRAAIMCCTVLASRILWREADGLTSLFLSIFLMALYNPYIILNSGFILSVLSVLGILLYSKKLSALFSKVLPPIASDAAGVCISAQLMVTPALIFLYNTLNPYALVSNLLVFFFASLFVIFGMIFSVVAFIPFVSFVLRLTIIFLSDVLVAILRFISYLPYASIENLSLSPVFIILWASFLLLLLVGVKERKYLYSISAFTLAALTACTFYNVIRHDDVYIKFLSHPVYDSSAVFFPNGENALIEVNSSEDALLLCERYGKEGFTYVVVTEKSFNNALELVRQGKVKNLILPVSLNKSSVRKTLREISDYKTDYIFLNTEEKAYFSKDISFSYPSLCYDKSFDAIMLGWKGKRFITLSMLPSKFSEFIESSGTIACDVLKLPTTFSKDYNRLETKTNAVLITDQKNFFITDK